MPARGLKQVVVVKLNPRREETWRYSGTILSADDGAILLEAFFNRPDRKFHGILMREGDRFLEKYYLDRWYNIYEIHDRDDDRVKAWYCNVSQPAEWLNETTLAYVDLALDLLVYPDGTMLALDEDEFAALELDDERRLNATTALEELKAQFSSAASFKLE